MSTGKPKPTLPRPTEAELGILRVLWTRGASTVREVHATLGSATGYTTVLKLMQIMAEKGLVVRDEEQRAHVYRVAIPEETTQRQLTSDFLQRAFGGSATRLMMHLVHGHAGPEELAELRRMLEEAEAEQGGRS